MTRLVVVLAGALVACGGSTPAGSGTCSRAGVDVPGSSLKRDGGDAGHVDGAAAREISEAVANEALRGLEAKHRQDRPNLSLALIDFDVQPSEPAAVAGCVTYGFSYVYRQPTGRELGPGESHFDVFVAENGKAWILSGK